MQRININDLDFENLKEVSNQGSTSIIFHDDNDAYKIFNSKISDNHKDEILKKLSAITENCIIDNVILLNGQIVDNDNMSVGYKSNFIEGQSLKYYFSNKKVINMEEILLIFYKVSKVIRNIHDQGIIHYDINLDNIIISPDKKIKLIDFDGCSFNTYQHRMMSIIVYEYLTKRKITLADRKDIDTLSLLLNLFYVIFNKKILMISKLEYNYAASKSQTIYNLKDTFNVLKSNKKERIKLRYLDEYIDLNDQSLISNDIFHLRKG